jgi:hypothetical protein
VNRLVLHRSDWLKIAGVVLASAAIGLVFFLVLDGARARSDLLEQTLDIRQAQSRRIDLLEAELARLSSENAESRAAVVALTEQLQRIGVDPILLPAEPGSPAGPEPAPASRAPAGRETSRPRPAETEPDSQSSPQPQPSGNPENPPPPPQDPPPEEEPCPVPELPIVGCPV